MQTIARAINAFAAALSTAAGFLAVMATLVVCGAIMAISGFSEGAQLGSNLYLSVLAIVIGCAILVAGDRDTRAIHTKLDELILASAARNDAVGIEHRTAEEIEAVRRSAEAECE